MKRTLTHIGKASQTIIAVMVLTLSLTLAARADANSFVILTDGDADVLRVLSWANALNAQGHETCVAGNEPWPDAPDRELLQEASRLYDEATNLYLDLNLKAAAQKFEAAFDAYRELLELHPFDQSLLERAAEAGFYWARCLFEKNDRRNANQLVAQILTRLPTVTPSASTFPPDFRQQIETLRNRRKRLSSLSVQVSPPNAQISVNGVSLQPDSSGYATLDNLEPGRYQLAVGLKELGFQLKEVTVRGSESTVDVNLLSASDVASGPVGLPWSEKQLRPISRQHGNADAILWLSNARLEDAPNERLAFIQWLADGQVSGAFTFDRDRAISRQGKRKLADAIIKTLNSDRMEIFRIEKDRLIKDDALSDTILARLGGSSSDDSIEPEAGASSRFGLYLGTGAGLAVQVTHPGFAPTPLLLRTELVLPVSDAISFGVGGRVQLTKFAMVGEPFLRWDLYPMSVSTGLAIGTVTQTITDTENRDRSTQKWVGPSFGLGMDIGGFRVAMSALSVLVPDQSIQFDLLLGTEFGL